jgi:hypothetical protein
LISAIECFVWISESDTRFSCDYVGDFDPFRYAAIFTQSDTEDIKILNILISHCVIRICPVWAAKSLHWSGLFAIIIGQYSKHCMI